MDLTVVIPTYERRLEVMRLLGSLDPPSGTEVVVVVDGSSDGTAEAVRALRPAFSLRVVEQPHAGVAAARNRGMEVAVSDRIVFLDDDMVCAPGFFSALLDAWGPADVVQARVLLGDWVPAGPAADEAARWLGERHEELCAGRFTSSTVLFWAAGVRGAAVREVGGFDESFDIGEDVELAHRLLTAGCSIRYAPAAVATTGWRTLPAPALARAQARGAVHARLVVRHAGLEASLFSDPLQRSRLHRAVGGVVLRVPGAARLVRPVTTRLTRFTRGWQLARAFAYWSGVAEARAGAGPPVRTALTERVIEPRPQARLGRALRTLWASRDTVLAFAERDVRLRYKVAALGLAWAALQPLAYLAVLSVAFGALAGVEGDGAPYPASVLPALVGWTYLATAVSTGANALVSDAGLLRRAAFPREAPVLGAVLAAGLDLAIGLALVAVLGPLLGATVGWSWLLAPLLALLLVVLAAGIACGLAGLVAYYRDVRFVVPITLQLWLFASPVAYPLTVVPEHWRLPYVLANPAAGVLEGLRQALAVGTLPDAGMLGAATASTTFVVLGGYRLLKRLEPGIVDVV